jgi:hypothetical protein
MPVTVMPRTAASCSSTDVNDPAGVPCAEKCPLSASTPNAARPYAPPAPSNTTCTGSTASVHPAVA